jgi:DNA-binding transcriptional LysR family regulator
MELNRIGDIAAFVAAVDSGSYTRASSSVGLSRSAIGKSITRLEAQLGVRLLNRTTRQLSLTEEGRIMYDRCKQILEDLEEVDATMALRRKNRRVRFALPHHCLLGGIYCRLSTDS